jgi:hypothetical protein
VYFAWQDTRNALGESGSEDIYTSSVPLAPVMVRESSSGIPGWTLLLTGLFGLGLGIVLAWLMIRRRDAQTTPAAPRGTPARA